MKVYKTKEELLEAPEVIQTHMDFILGNVLERDITNTNYFEWLLGGFVYELETLEDLREVTTDVETPDGNDWKTLDSAAGYYDAANKIDGYTVLFLITNNSGGPIYFIPEWMEAECPYIEESFNLTNES